MRPAVLNGPSPKPSPGLASSNPAYSQGVCGTQSPVVEVSSLPEEDEVSSTPVVGVSDVLPADVSDEPAALEVDASGMSLVLSPLDSPATVVPPPPSSESVAQPPARANTNAVMGATIGFTPPRYGLAPRPYLTTAAQIRSSRYDRDRA